MLHATMLPPMRKRQRRTEGTEGPRYGVEVKFPDVRLYLVEKKMGATRRGFLAQLARAKGFLVEDVLRLGISLNSLDVHFTLQTTFNLQQQNT